MTRASEHPGCSCPLDGNSRGSGLLKGCEAIAVIVVLMTQSPKNAALDMAACWVCRGAPAPGAVWSVAAVLGL